MAGRGRRNNELLLLLPLLLLLLLPLLLLLMRQWCRGDSCGGPSPIPTLLLLLLLDRWSRAASTQSVVCIETIALAGLHSEGQF